MTIIKTDEKWFRAEQFIENGILSYVVTAYASTQMKAIKKLMRKLYESSN